MLKKIFLYIALLSFCGFPRAVYSEEVKIGLILPLTGNQSVYGIDARRAAELLQSGDYLKSKKHSYKLILENGECGMKNAAVTAAQKLINVDKAKFLVVACSGETLQVGPIAEKAEVITIAFASSHPDVKQLGEYVFRSYVEITKGVSLIAKLMKKEKKKRIAVLTEESAFTLGIKSDLKRFLGDSISFTADFHADESDFRTLLLRAKSRTPDAYYLNTASPKTYQALFNQVRQLGITDAIYAYHAPADPDVLKGLGKLQDGTKFIAVPEVEKGSNEFEAFYADFRKKYPEGANIECLLRTSYDAIMSIITAVEIVGPNTKEVKDFLYTHEMDGAIGKVAFDEYGDIKDLNFVLKEIVDGTPKRIH